MYAIQEAKTQVLKELKAAVGKGFSPATDDLSIPPDPSMGDIAFPCFTLAKGMKKNPAEVALELAAKIGPKGFVKSVKAAGPFVNFTLDDATFGSEVVKEILKMKGRFGTSTTGQKRTVLVEFANINTHKMIHIGHLRNFFVGQMAVNVLKANGYKVVPGFYINDLGLHVAKCLWAMKKFHEGEDGKDVDRIALLGKAYAEATQAAEKDESVKAEISSIYKNLENMIGEYVPLWKKTKKWSMEYFHSMFKELGLTLTFKYFESDLISETKTIVEDLIKKGIALKSEGAWIVDLQDKDLGVNLLVKSDGTLLYNAKDLALAARKKEDYAPWRSIYVVDARQSHVLKQLFETLELMGLKEDLVHLSFDFVTLKGGAMASRKGNVIRYEEFRDELINLAEEETLKRHKDWTEKKVQTVARAIAFSAMRFGMLKQDREKKIVFDMEEAVSFEGYSGPYLLYSLARIKSIRKKAGRAKVSAMVSKTSLPVEHELIIVLSKYPEIVFRSSEQFDLSALAQYLFDLAKTWASYYEQVPILKSEHLQSERLAIARAVEQVLENGLGLLGIEAVEEM